MGPLEWMAIGFIIYILYRGLFAPSLAYDVHEALDLTNTRSISLLATISDAGLYSGNRVEVLTDGANFYSAELDAIEQAEASVNIEAYIFYQGEIAGKFADVLTRKAQSGVKVNVLIDALGSALMGLRRGLLTSMRAAGCKVLFYHPLDINTLERVNIRTHRELIVIDGRVAFVGGAGVADHWYKKHKKQPAWRDSMVRVEGPAVAGVQGMFVENWLESSGEVLTGVDYFPALQNKGEIRALVANSSSKGRSTHARILFQVLLASAKKSIYIATPYFLPDAAVRKELVSARARGVDVKVVTTSKKTDHLITRGASRRLYGQLLREGVEIFEYQPTMFHVKMLLVDGLWSVIGTTNFDHRSFSINDEVNLAIPDAGVNLRLAKDFFRDVERSRLVTYKRWSQRALSERVLEQFGRLLERQQ